MIKVIRNILITLAATLAAIGCIKTSVPDKGQEGSPILLTAVEAGSPTKALLDKGTFSARGNRIQVYDFVTDGTTTTKHIDAYAGPDVDSGSSLHTYGYTWPFEDKVTGNPATYQWIPGTHKFFGWLAKDANFGADNPMTPEEFFGGGFNFEETDHILTISPKAIDHTTPQFDFLYSNIVTTEPQNNPVDMAFAHLFTAVSIGVENSTSYFVTVEDFRIERIPSTRGTSINFNGTTTTVNYSEWTEGAWTSRGLDIGKDGYEVSPKSLRSNIFDGSTTQQFMILWPVEAQYLHSTEKMTVTDGEVVYPDSWKMYIKYSADGKTYEKRINFPNVSWEAGNKYHFTIVFADKVVELRTEVKPWEYDEQIIDYTNEVPSLSEGGALTWKGIFSKVEDDKKMVSIIDAHPAEAMFTLQTPIGGSWIVSLVGDINAFEVFPSTGIINSHTATIFVRPLVKSPTRDYKVKLKFTIRRSDGRMISADNIIQANGVYTVVLPRNN
jgi:hypothetical protein